MDTGMYVCQFLVQKKSNMNAFRSSCTGAAAQCKGMLLATISAKTRRRRSHSNRLCQISVVYWLATRRHNNTHHTPAHNVPSRACAKGVWCAAASVTSRRSRRARSNKSETSCPRYARAVFHTLERFGAGDTTGGVPIEGYPKDEHMMMMMMMAMMLLHPMKQHIHIAGLKVWCDGAVWPVPLTPKGDRVCTLWFRLWRKHDARLLLLVWFLPAAHHTHTPGVCVFEFMRWRRVFYVPFLLFAAAAAAVTSCAQFSPRLRLCRR